MPTPQEVEYYNQEKAWVDKVTQQTADYRTKTYRVVEDRKRAVEQAEARSAMYDTQIASAPEGDYKKHLVQQKEAVDSSLTGLRTRLDRAYGNSRYTTAKTITEKMDRLCKAVLDGIEKFKPKPKNGRRKKANGGEENGGPSEPDASAEAAPASAEAAPASE